MNYPIDVTKLKLGNTLEIETLDDSFHVFEIVDEGSDFLNYTNTDLNYKNELVQFIGSVGLTGVLKNYVIFLKGLRIVTKSDSKEGGEKTISTAQVTSATVAGKNWHYTMEWSTENNGR